jgi:hypothetical protein
VVEEWLVLAPEQREYYADQFWRDLAARALKVPRLLPIEIEIIFLIRRGL